MRISILLILIIGVFTALVSYYYILSFENFLSIALPGTIPDEISQIFESEIGTFNGIDISFQFILSNNLRAIGMIFLLGLVSFGVLGVIVYLGNMGLIGAVLALIKLIGYSPTQIALSGIMPHGIFELPAIILTSAAVLHIGIMLVTPNSQRSLGEVLIESIADWVKIAVGLALPLLAIAAAIETWLTPYLLLSVIK
jgi:stage II sporulation protein M